MGKKSEKQYEFKIMAKTREEERNVRQIVAELVENTWIQKENAKHDHNHDFPLVLVKVGDTIRRASLRKEEKLTTNQ